MITDSLAALVLSHGHTVRFVLDGAVFAAIARTEADGSPSSELSGPLRTRTEVLLWLGY